MKAREAIIKQNLEFIYGKKASSEAALPDPDKVSYVRRESQPKGYAADEAIVGFTGEWEILHPSYKTPVYLKGDPEPYPSFEHALHASKFVQESDRSIIRSTTDVIEVKRFASKHKNDSSHIFADWNDRNLGIARQILRDKFMRNRQLKFTLMKTGHKKLIFVNDFNDQYWGVIAAGHKGQNHLGLLLQEIRKEIDYGDDIDKWIADNLSLRVADDVRFIVDIDDPTNQALNIKKTDKRNKISSAKSGSSHGSKKGEEKEEVEEDPTHKEFDRRQFIYLGSADFNDVQVHDTTVSRVHAAVVVGATQEVYVIDLGSSNGTFIRSPTINPTSETTSTTERITIAPFVFHRVSAASSKSIFALQFGHSSALYSFTVLTNATEVRQAELLTKLTDTNNGNNNNNENTVFVRNLDPKTSEEDVREFFGTCGEIASLHIPRDKHSQLASKGIAFVTFASHTAVYQALTLDGDLLGGSYVKVKRSDANIASTNAPSTGRGDNNSKRPSRQEIAENAMRMSGSNNGNSNNNNKRGTEDKPSHYGPSAGYDPHASRASTLTKKDDDDKDDHRRHSGSPPRDRRSEKVEDIRKTTESGRDGDRRGRDSERDKDSRDRNHRPSDRREDRRPRADSRGCERRRDDSRDRRRDRSRDRDSRGARGRSSPQRDNMATGRDQDSTKDTARRSRDDSRNRDTDRTGGQDRMRGRGDNGRDVRREREKSNDRRRTRSPSSSSSSASERDRSDRRPSHRNDSRKRDQRPLHRSKDRDRQRKRSRSRSSSHDRVGTARRDQDDTRGDTKRSRHIDGDEDRSSVSAAVGTRQEQQRVQREPSKSPPRKRRADSSSFSSDSDHK